MYSAFIVHSVASLKWMIIGHPSYVWIFTFMFLILDPLESNFLFIGFTFRSGMGWCSFYYYLLLCPNTKIVHLLKSSLPWAFISRHRYWNPSLTAQNSETSLINPIEDEKWLCQLPVHLSQLQNVHPVTYRYVCALTIRPLVEEATIERLNNVTHNEQSDGGGRGPC